MTETLEGLEQRRLELINQIAGLNDLRPGSISTTQGKCGKPNCCCVEDDHPGHGPHWRLTYKVEGRTRTQSLPDAVAKEKAEREVAEFRRFQQLSHEFVEVNTKICQLRSVQEATLAKKKRLKRSKGK